MANVLDRAKQIVAISALAEGSSIRAIERMTGIHRDTIMRLGVRVGQGCSFAAPFLSPFLSRFRQPRSKDCYWRGAPPSSITIPRANKLGEQGTGEKSQWPPWERWARRSPQSDSDPTRGRSP